MTIDKERLAELCKGRQEWRVANPVDGSYCMSSDNREALNPEREVRDWLSDHKLKFPDSRFSNYEVRCVTVTSEVEGGCIALLAENAALAAEVERTTNNRDMWKAQCAAQAQELERLRADHAAALGLVADVRFALGDNGKRMQPELIEWATGLRRDAERYQWLRDAYNRPTDEVDEDGAFVVGGIARIMVRTSTYGDATALALDELDAAIDAAMTKKDAAP